MKKIIFSILCLILCLGIPLNAYTEKFILDHYVELFDQFDVQKYFPDIRSGINRLAKITLRNNTLDGYTVTVHSQNQGNLSSVSAYQGETNIPYYLTFEKVNGDVGTGIVENFTPDISVLPTPVEILSTTDTQGSPSHLSLMLYVTIEDTANQLKMAGDYTDTIYINYTDN